MIINFLVLPIVEGAAWQICGVTRRVLPKGSFRPV